jgi:hypothetical protein
LHICVRQGVLQGVRDIAAKAPELANKKNWQQITPLDLAKKRMEDPSATVADKEILAICEESVSRAIRFKRKHDHETKRKKFAPGFASLNV